MNLIEAKTLLSNLLERVETTADGSLILSGLLTKKERESLVIALSLFDSSYPSSQSNADKLSNQPIQDERQSLKSDMETLELSKSSADMRLCFDFGTAMSKVTLVKDDDQNGEHIAVLKLGIPGNQEEIDEKMLVSSVYIGDDGLLWFGQKAVEMSQQTNDTDEIHERLDSIKLVLLEDNSGEEVDRKYNPTTVKVTYHDIILAYLMFLTWSACVCAEEEGCPRNICRRFAMPCLSEEIKEKVETLLSKLLGEAHVLAHIFRERLDANEGVPLESFLKKAEELKGEDQKYAFVAESIIEPVGVANSYFNNSDSPSPRKLALVVDVGAGTIDMALFWFWHHEKERTHKAAQIKGTSRMLMQAGNHLDNLLMESILNQAGVDHDNEYTRSIISLKIRGYKETLFEEKEVDVYIDTLGYELDANINLNDFLQTEKVKSFSEYIKSTMRDILENVDQSIITGITTNPLVVVLTGGGAKLPMIKKLASESLWVHENEISVEPALPIPGWLKKDHPDIALDYPRVAVSLGGARKNMITETDAIHKTAVDTHPLKKQESFVGNF